MKENSKENEKGNLKKEKNRMKIMEILCIISLLITIFSIQRTYARYFEQVDTTYNTNIKRWLVKVNDQIIHDAETLNEVMEPIMTENEHVNDQILVPGQTGYFEMLIDYTDVDVAFEYEFTMEQLNETPLDDFEIYGYEVWDVVDGVNTVIETTETSEIKGVIDPTTEFNSAGEKKREIRILFRWNDGEGSTMDNKTDTQFRGGENNTTNTDNTNEVENGTTENDLHTTLKYRAEMTFIQYIPPEEETGSTNIL